MRKTVQSQKVNGFCKSEGQESSGHFMHEPQAANNEYDG